MSDFRIFCELLAKMMLESIDFTDVLEGYRRNEKPEILGIATYKAVLPTTIVPVEMKSPRYWALQHSQSLIIFIAKTCRNEKPEILGIATIISCTVAGEIS